MNHGRTVILFFRQRGADDDAVASAVASVRGRRGVSVFTLPVGRAPRYAAVGGTQRCPSTHHRAPRDETDDPRMFEGYIDSATLGQAVADAR